jgi:hypothetical protein
MKFRTALPIVASEILPPRLARDVMVFVGTNVLVAAVNPSLGESVANSTTFISEKVLVATPSAPGGRRKLCVFCETCGINVMRKVSAASEQYYDWDWLADLRPRRFAAWRKL